jgi:hypothetical protein
MINFDHLWIAFLIAKHDAIKSSFSYLGVSTQTAGAIHLRIHLCLRGAAEQAF